MYGVSISDDNTLSPSDASKPLGLRSLREPLGSFFKNITVVCVVPGAISSVDVRTSLLVREASPSCVNVPMASFISSPSANIVKPSGTESCNFM